MLNELLDFFIEIKITLAFVLEYFTVCNDYSRIINDLNDYQLAALQFHEDKLDEILSAT